MSETSVLIVTNSYDERESTAALRRIARAMESTDGMRTSVFLLRHSANGRRTWPGARVVDDLRRWLPATLVSTVSEVAAGRIRGLRLRVWLRTADPDVVILDDGLGARVIEHLRRRPVIVSRINAGTPSIVEDEPGPITGPDLVVAPAGTVLDTTAPVLRECDDGDFSAEAAYVDAAVRAQTRRRIDVPEGATVISGWGADGWLDGPDVFVRIVWALRERHGIDAHGLWFGSQLPDETRRLHEEAERCGLTGRYHIRPYDGLGETPLDALCSDVVVLPTREALLAKHLQSASASGLIVVTFSVAETADARIWAVPDLDVDAAAAAAARALEGDRADRSRTVMLETDTLTWVRHLVEVAGRSRT